jgi:hypothetical protein
MHIAATSRARFLRHLGASVFIVPLLLSSCSALGTKAPRVANLSGDWKLDQALSEDPRGVLRQQRQSRHGGGGGMHRHGGGGLGMPGAGGTPGGGMSRNGGYGGNGGGGPSGGGGRSFAGANSVIADFVAQPAAIEIKQESKDLALEADGVSTHFVYGEKVVASVQGGTAERISGWKGNAFVVKYNVSDGPVATRSYETGDAGRQLIVTTHVDGERAPKFEFRTVYDRVPAG